MDLREITPVVLTLNEEANLERTLGALAWAHRVVVLDSGSSDATAEIAARYANVEWRIRPFDNHAAQCNHALDDLVADGAWTLFLDADYVMPEPLRQEIAALNPGDETSGYWIPFRYCIDGHPLRGTLYPPRICLFRTQRGRYRQHGHTQLLDLNGDVAALSEPMLHDDRKPASNFAQRQRRYAELEAQYLLSMPWSQQGWRKRLRRMLLVAPWAAPIYALFAKGVILDGVPGFKYAWERAQAEALIAAALARRMFGLHRKNSA